MNAKEIELKTLHDQRQAGISDDEICIREGVVIKAAQESRYGFEFFCWRSPDMISEMDLFIQHAKGKKCLLDIGALHGIFSLVFAEINKRCDVYALEPEPVAYKVLRSNCDIIFPRVLTFNIGLSDSDKHVKVKSEWEHFAVSEDGDQEMFCRRGDAMCAGLSASPDMLKIDVEGMEFDVLRGLRETIKSNHPLIFLELHPQRMIEKGDSVQEFLDMMYAWGYTAIDTRTNAAISYQEILSTTDIDLRLILS